jgi:membrane-associated protein
MNLDEFFSQVFSLAGTYSLTLATFLFLICFIGEALAIAVPYALETVWLLAGYQLSKDMMSVPQLLVLLLAAQMGRQTGALVFGKLGRLGITPLKRFLERFKFFSSLSQGTPARMLQRVNLLSPFSVALGRLLWLRVPLTLLLSAQNKFGVLALAVLISGIVWDCSYVLLGSVVGATVKVETFYVILLFIAGLTVLYVIGFIARRVYQHAVNGHAGRTQ